MEKYSMPKRAIEIILNDEVQALFNSFSSCFDIRIVFFAPDGEVLTSGRPRPCDSRYCTLVQKHLYGEARCLELDAEKREAAARDKKTVFYQCHAGLCEAIVPVFARKSLLGFVMIGQFRGEKKVPVNVRTDWKRTRDAHEIEKAFTELPLVPPEKTQDVLTLFSILVEYIVSRNLIALKGNLLLEEILAFIRNNIDRPISLAQAAALVHRSESTVSHLFQERLGRSFRETVIEEKLTKAEEYMRTIPNITVAQTAALVGYTDPFHFSNLYKKHRGLPPSEYMKRQIA